MKSKKEFLLLALIIVVLGVYLFMRSTDRVHYDLPVLSPVDPAEITSVEITTGTSTLVLTRVDETWHLTPAQWPADSSMMQDILKVLELLKISDLVSKAKAYTRYDLDAVNGISVQAYNEGTLIRDFILGKTAPTYRHTFIRLSGDDNVYMAEGDFRRVFDVTPEMMRDKLVLSFPKEEITRITIIGKDTAVTVSSEEIGEKNDSEGTEPKASVTWKNDQGQDIEPSVVSALLSPLSRLLCETYLNDREPADLTDPLYTISLSGKNDYSLSIYASSQHQENPAASSQTPFVFLMPDYLMEKIEEFITKAQKIQE